jgi:hypothetical protein
MPKYADLKSEHRSVREDRVENSLKASTSAQQNAGYAPMTQESLDY